MEVMKGGDEGKTMGMKSSFEMKNFCKWMVVRTAQKCE